MMGTQTTLAVAPALYRKFSIDATRDFVGVAKAGISPLVLVVHPSVPARSVMDLIALAKAGPGTINFGSGGLGTTPHMAGELFSIQAGIKMVHVAYRGEAPAINDLLGGQLHLIFANLSAVIGNVKAGSLRALAVTSAQRAATAPEIPTVAEAALPGFEAATWFALVAPAGTPREIVRRLNTEVTQLVTQPDVRQRFADLGMTIDAGTPDALDAYIKSEMLSGRRSSKRPTSVLRTSRAGNRHPFAFDVQTGKRPGRWLMAPRPRIQQVHQRVEPFRARTTTRPA
jgi:tripartite-type tricarboxylate transporter receptor subunit TctC